MGPSRGLPNKFGPALAHLRNLLRDEPHVRGLGYGQYADEVEADLGEIELLQELQAKPLLNPR